MSFNSYNEYHLGDNLVHLHYLRKLALAYPDREFNHFMPGHFIPTLCHIADVPNRNIKLFDLSVHGPSGQNAWKNVGGFWSHHKHRGDWTLFHLDWFKNLADGIGLKTPFTSAEQFLFDYPQLTKCAMPVMDDYDVLFVNSEPCSGQFLAYTADEMDAMMVAMMENGLRVICTKPTNCRADCTSAHDLSITQIGNLSLRCKYHVMVATGPMWTTLNVWNVNTTDLRLVLLDKGERLTFPVPIEQTDSIAEAWAILERYGLTKKQVNYAGSDRLNVSALIPSRLRCDQLKRCIRSVFASADHPESVECVVRLDKDDASTVDRIREIQRISPNIQIIVGDPGGYNGQCTYYWEMSQAAKGQWLWMLNDDATVAESSKGWDNRLMGHAPGGKIILPEWDCLSQSAYRHNRSHPFYFLPNGWWKPFGLTHFANPIDRYCERFLRNRGWRVEWLAGLTTHHDRNEQDALMKYNLANPRPHPTESDEPEPTE